MPSCFGIGATTRVVQGLVVRELGGPAVFQIFNPNREGNGLMYPEMFFLAAGELLSFMIFASAIITYIVQPLAPQCYDGYDLIEGCNITALESNAIMDRVGHNNPCVYFDVPPAKYFAAIVYVFAAYCGIRYTLLDMERTLLVKQESDRLNPCIVAFSLVSDVLYMFAWAGFVMTYVIPPWEDIWGHSLGFICLGTAQFLIFFSNVLEGENFPCCVYIFCFIYGAFTIAEFGFAAAGNFIYYSHHGKPWLPNLLGSIIDYGWFATLALTSAVMPRSEGLKRFTELEPAPNTFGNEDEEDEEADIGLNEDED